MRPWDRWTLETHSSASGRRARALTFALAPCAAADPALRHARLTPAVTRWSLRLNRPRLSARELNRTLACVFRAFRETDALILSHLNKARIRYKSDGSEVTVADRGAEQALRRHLRAAWPHDALLGEEYGGHLAPHGRCWLLDPIDGTASYVLGMPMFGTLVSLLIDGEPVFGCIRLPALRETTYAARGFGCHLRRDGGRARRVQVAPTRALRTARLGLTSFKESDLAAGGGPWRLSELARATGRIRLVGDCVQ